MQSNYDKQAQNARALFVTYDQREMIEKHGLEHDDDYLYLTFIGDRYRISRETGEIFREAGEWETCGDYNVVMTLYDVLCFPQTTPRLSHEWCALRGLQATINSPNPDIFSRKYANAFAGHGDRLWRACRKLGGQQAEIAAGADVYCQFDVFPFFPVQFRFWDADDEFPAAIQLLWDKNSLAFMHFETLYYVMLPLLDKLLALFREERP